MQEDPILLPVARAHLASWLRGEGIPERSLPAQPGACSGTLACSLKPGEGVERCFQRWLVSAEARAPLLDAGCDLGGLAVGGAEGELRLLLELGEDG